MADSNLNVPVIIQAARLDTSVLPRNIFSQSYLLYVIAQGTDVGNVANKANEAGQGAYDAQVRNDEQDVILVDHEIRLASAEAKIYALHRQCKLMQSFVYPVILQSLQLSLSSETCYSSSHAA